MGNLNVRSFLLLGHCLGQAPVSAFVTKVNRGTCLCVQVEGLVEDGVLNSGKIRFSRWK